MTIRQMLMLGVSVACSLSTPCRLLAQQIDSTVRETLPNGLKVVIIRNDFAPIVTVRAIVHVGGSDSSARYAGIAHAQEHMSFRGCAGLTGEQIAAIYSQLGDDNNAETGETMTEFYATVPAKDLDVALELQVRCLVDVDDAPQEWTEERRSLEEEVAETSADPEFKMWQAIEGSVLAGTPYANDALGTKASLRNITSSKLKKFYYHWYTASNTTLLIVGNLDTEATLRRVESMYGEIPYRPSPSRSPVRLSPLRPQQFSLPGDLPYSRVCLAYRLPGTKSPDFSAMLVLSAILASSRSDLHSLAVSSRGIDTTFTIEATYEEVSIGMAAFSVTGQHVASPLRQLLEVMETYSRNGVPEELFDSAKRQLLAEKSFAYNSSTSTAEAWSQAIADGRNSPEEEVKEIQSVVLLDVNRVAGKYLTNATTVKAVLRSRKPSLQQVFVPHKHSVKDSSKPLKPVSLPDWAAKSLTQLEPLWNGPRLREMILHNGIRLVVRPVPGSPTVSLFGQVNHDPSLQTFGNQNSVSEVLELLYPFGSRDKNRVALQKSFDDLCAQEQAGYHFSLTSPKDSFSQALKLLAEHEIQPALPADALALVKRQLAQLLDREANLPDYRADDILDHALLPKNDPTLRTTSVGGLLSLTTSQVRRYQTDTIRPDLTTIVLFGDLSAEEAKDLVEQAFADWQAIGPKPELALPPVPLNRASIVNVLDRSRKQSSVALAEQVTIDQNGFDTIALQLGNQILGGGFYAGRLYHSLRHSNGYVYAVDVDLTVSPTRIVYDIDFACNPRNLSAVRSTILFELGRMQTELVSVDELQRAKASLLRQLVLKEQSPEDEAAELLDQAANGLPLTDSSDTAQQLLHLTSEDIRSAFARDVRLRDFVEVDRGPVAP